MLELPPTGRDAGFILERRESHRNPQPPNVESREAKLHPTETSANEPREERLRHGNPPNVHISRAPALTPPKFHEKTAKRRKKENCGG